ncbi:hypothetical protein GCM10023205_28810 [Yinghuangia aomiensis]|uniref:Uncharacterized protein n=1 Tax=Yinghuangia aomiensis TaxID=676205 RepID=A0ABP9H7L6_9ACTN
MSSLPDRQPGKPTPAAPNSASGPAAADGTPDPAVLARAVRRLADRYRHLSESRLRARIDPDGDDGVTRAALGLALSRRLAELGDKPAAVEVPDLGMFAVGDQIAVTGLDLVRGLQAAWGEPGAEGALAEALAAVREVAALV